MKEMRVNFSAKYGDPDGLSEVLAEAFRFYAGVWHREMFPCANPTSASEALRKAVKIKGAFDELGLVGCPLVSAAADLAWSAISHNNSLACWELVRGDVGELYAIVAYGRTYSFDAESVARKVTRILRCLATDETLEPAVLEMIGFWFEKYQVIAPIEE